MLYSIKDKFLIGDMLVEVVYINNGKAWVAPTEDIQHETRKDLSCTAINVLDEYGIDKEGQRAIFVNSNNSGAV